MRTQENVLFSLLAKLGLGVLPGVVPLHSSQQNSPFVTSTFPGVG